jgi:hypothetical protein
MLGLSERATIEEMFRDTDGKRVTFDGGETWGHFVVEPQVELEDVGVLDNVPTLVVPSAACLRMDALINVEGEGFFHVNRRLPASAPGEEMLVLRRYDE